MKRHNLTTIERDRLDYQKAQEKFENKVYKDTILAIESQIEEKDKMIKDLTKKIHNPKHHSNGDLRNFRIQRKKLKKDRENLRIKLDLLRK